MKNKPLYKVLVLLALLISILPPQTAILAATEVNIAALSTKLDIPFINQFTTGATTKKNDCGPVNVAMIVIAYGKRPPNLTMAQFIGQIREKMGKTGNVPTGSYDRQKALAAYDISSTIIKASDPDPLQTMKNALAQGKPVIARVYYTKKVGHVIVVTGFSDDGNTVYINDPNGGSQDAPWTVNKFKADMLKALWINSEGYGQVINTPLTSPAALGTINLPVYAIDASKTYFLEASHSGKVLTASDSSVVQSPLLNNVNIFNFPLQKMQQWIFVPLTGQDTNYYKIVSTLNSNLCLDVNQESKNAGAKIILYQCTNGDNQKWKLYNSKGLLVIQAKHSGLVLDVIGSSQNDKATVIQYNFLDQPNQKWKLVEVVPPTPTKTPMLVPTVTRILLPTSTKTLILTATATKTPLPTIVVPSQTSTLPSIPSTTPTPIISFTQTPTAPATTINTEMPIATNTPVQIPTNTLTFTPTFMPTLTPIPQIRDKGQFYWSNYSPFAEYYGSADPQWRESWYFRLTAQRKFTIEVVTTSGNLTAKIMLYNSNWALLDSANGSGGYINLTSTQPTAYPYYVTIEQLGNTYGNYTLRILCVENCPAQ